MAWFKRKSKGTGSAVPVSAADDDTEVRRTDHGVEFYRNGRLAHVWWAGDGEFEQEVAGESYHAQEILDYIDLLDDPSSGRDEIHASLYREPDNPHDRNAIRVVLITDTVGYIPAADAARLAPYLDSFGPDVEFSCPALITWNPARPESGHRIRLDVVHDPAVKARTDKAKERAEQAAAAADTLLTQGRVVDLWGATGQPNIDTVGESRYTAALRQVMTAHAPGPLGSDGVEVFTTAVLVARPEPDDADAIGVHIDGQQVAVLPSSTVDGLPTVIARLAADGAVAAAPARVWARDIGWDGSPDFMASVRLALGPVDLAVPVNPPPLDPYRVLPTGRLTQVQGEDAHLDVLAPVVADGDRSVHLTLHEAAPQEGARAKKPLVEVRLDGHRVGTLTPAMSAEFLPVIRHLDARGITTTVRGLVRGNALKADVAFRAARSGELPSEWLAAVGS